MTADSPGDGSPERTASKPTDKRSPKKAPPPPVILLWGEEPFLLRDEALRIFADIRPLEVNGADWQGGETADLATPSLFGERRGLLVTDAKELPGVGVKEVARYAQAPSPDALLILTARVAERSKQPPAALAKIVDPSATRQMKVDRKDLPAWVGQRGVAKGLEVEPAASQALIAALGEEAAELDQALNQLADAFPGQRITPALIAQQFRGLGEQKVWDLCDRAFARDLPGAIHSLRALLLAREDPLKILGGISLRVRELLKVRSLPEHASPKDVTAAAGLRFDWQARKYQEQARRFTMEQLVEIHGGLVQADNVLKLGANGDVVLASLVSAIAG